MFSRFSRWVLAASGFLIAGACQAGSLTANLKDEVDKGQFTVNNGGSGGTLPTNYAYAGALLWARTGGTDSNIVPPNPPSGQEGLQFYTFCIQISQGVPPGQWNDVMNFPGNAVQGAGGPPFSGSGPGGTDTAGQTKQQFAMRDLFGRFFKADVLTDPLKSAAFQLAIWEIVYDGQTDTKANTNSLSNGAGFFVTSSSSASVVAMAQNALNIIFADYNDGVSSDITHLANVSKLFVLTDSSFQDQIIYNDTPPGDTSFDAPEPTTMVLAATGGLLMVAGYRRRKNAKKVA